MENFITTETGSKNKTWLKNRIANGTVVVLEKNFENELDGVNYYPMTAEEALRTLPMMSIYESNNKIISAACGTSYYYKFQFAVDVKVLLNNETVVEPKEESHTFDNQIIVNLKVKKMKNLRNLVVLAIAFSVMPSEEDVEQLGFEPTEDEFRKYFEIPAEAKVDGSYVHTKDFDAYGDLYWMLNDSEKDELNPEAKEAVGVDAKEPEIVAEAKEFVIPAEFLEKHKTLSDSIVSFEKELAKADKALEKLKLDNIKKIEKAKEFSHKAETKAGLDETNPVLAKQAKEAKSAFNEATKAGTKSEKDLTSSINKASAGIITAKAKLQNFVSKVSEKQEALEAKAKAKADKVVKATTPKVAKEATELSRSKNVYLLIGKGWSVKQICEANPDWSKVHVTNCSQSLKKDATLLAKLQKVADSLKIVIPEAPIVVEAPAEAPAAAVEEETATVVE